MLTADLIQARVRGDKIHPTWVNPAHPGPLRLAERLTELYQRHDGGSRGELDEALKDLIGDAPNFTLARGLAKLLDDRSTWEVVSPVDPVELREEVFSLAASRHPVVSVATATHPTTRREILEIVAARHDVTVTTIEDALYADLKEAYRLVAHRALEPEALLERYNLSLAQALLLKADTVTVRFWTDRPSRARAFFRDLKFHKLMHRASRRDDGWTVVLDGPMSLFGAAGRYGLNLALMLPSVLHLDRWELTCEVRWRNDRRVRLELTPEAPIAPPRRQRGVSISPEEAAIVDRINKGKEPWRVERATEVIDLDGRDVLVPDFTLVHEDGRRALVEILGYWRRSYVERRAALIAEHGPPHLIVCVSRRLADGKERLEQGTAAVIDFAQVIPKKALLALADEVAQNPDL